PAARHRRREHGRVAGSARAAPRSRVVRDGRRPRPDTKVLAGAEEATAARLRARQARPRPVRPAEIRFRAADRRVGETTLAAGDGIHADQRGVDQPRWTRAQHREGAVELVHRRTTRPLLVARLGAVRASRLVRAPRHGACRMSTPARNARVLLVSALQVYPTR